MSEKLYTNSGFPMGLSRSSAIAIYAIGHLDELREKGMIRGGLPLTDKGREAFQALLDIGFKPTNEELKNCIDSMQREISRGL